METEALNKMKILLSEQSIAMLEKMIIELLKDPQSDDLIFDLTLNELESKMDDDSFIKFCNSLAAILEEAI